MQNNTRLLPFSDVTIHSPATEGTSESELGIKPSSTRKTAAVRSTRTPNTMFSGDSKLRNPSAPIVTSTRTGRDKPLNRVQTAPRRTTEHATAAETTPPRHQQTSSFPLSISQSQSSDSQTLLTPDAHSALQNQRESVASSFPSSYHSAEESFNASLIDDEVPPLPNPHPLSTSITESKQTPPTAQTPLTSASEQTVIPTEESGLTYRISARTTTSTGTRTTGRSASTSASVMEPSRQSTSDSDAYPRGNGIGGHGQPSKNRTAEGGEEEDLAELVAGWEQLVEEPEFDYEEPKWDAKGKMKMPEPQYFGTRLSTTREEDEELYGDYQDYEGGQSMRMPEPFTHSRDQSSSTQQTLYAEISSGQSSSFPTGTTIRKVSPLVIPPTPKSPPPVPLSIRGEKQAQIGSIVDPTTQGKSSTSTDPNPDEDKTQNISYPLRAGPSNPNTGGVAGGTSPLRVHRKRPASATTAGGEGTSPATTGTEKDNGLQHYGTATITGLASSRIERPERPGSSGGGALARTSLGTGSTNISGTASGRVKTESTSHRPSIDVHTYAHGRTTSTASASGVTRPSETRMSGGSTRLPALPTPAKDKPSAPTTASAVVAAATIPSGSRLPPGVSSQMDTQYVNMLLALDDIPTIHNFAAAFFNWIYLAGFVLFPGTFTSLRNLSADQGNGVPAQVINTVTRLPL